MDDTISRSAAIDAIEFGITYARAINKETGEVKELFQDANDELRKAVKRVKELPTAQQWIPCSKRMPEGYTDVLVWFEYYRYGDYNCSYQTYGIGDYVAKYDSWLINHETGWRELRVFAWMPLPKPWKGEEK